MDLASGQRLLQLLEALVGDERVVQVQLTKALDAGGRAEAVKRVIRRGILLYVVGIFYSGGFSHPWPDLRLLGVLNRIALAYLFAGLLFCFFKPRSLAIICGSLLVGYWALMTFVPIRDIQLTRSNIARL